MQCIINSRRYDTDVAELVHHWDNGRHASELHYRGQTLYHTARGAWFIHHVGGAMTDMARRCDHNSYTRGESIEPVSEDDARRFLETHGGEAALEQQFPGAIEDA
jgi:hypothetical protein